MRIVGKRSEGVHLDEFLSRPLFAHLATSSEEGSRHSPVWFLWEDGVIWIIANPKENTLHERVERDPRCAVGIVDFDRGSGLVQHVGFRGRATLDPFDRDRARRLFARYLGENEGRWDVERFVASLDDPDNLFVRLVPQTAVVRDQSYAPPERS